MGSLRQLKHKYPCYGRWKLSCERTCYEAESCRSALVQSTDSCLVRQVSILVTDPEWSGPVIPKKTILQNLELESGSLYFQYQDLVSTLGTMGFKGTSQVVSLGGRLIPFLAVRQDIAEQVKIVLSEVHEGLYSFNTVIPNGYTRESDGRLTPRFKLEPVESWSFTSSSLPSLTQKLLATIISVRKQRLDSWEV